MLDRLLYRNQWFCLPNQRPFEECFWSTQRKKKPFIGHPPRPLREDEYACDWKIESRKLWLLSAILEEDGSDLLFRLLPGQNLPVLADWHSGVIDANGDLLKKDGLNQIPIVRFTIESGRVKSTDHLTILPQPGWHEDEPSLRVREGLEGGHPTSMASPLSLICRAASSLIP